MKKILHICNDFCGSKVHANLYEALSHMDVSQTVFTYVRDSRLIGKNMFSSFNVDFIYSDILKLYHRIIYQLKIRDIYREITSKVDINNYDCIHAVTLFSDGGVAYKINKFYKKPYVVTVRATDLEFFLKYAPHTWIMGKKILLNASRIIFISNIAKNKFCQHVWVKTILTKISHKMVVQPNGIDNYWLNHVNKERCINKNILFVGKFDSNKNVIRLIKAVLEIYKIDPEVRLNLVGGQGRYESKVLDLVKKNSKVLYYYGPIYDKECLRKIYNGSMIFALPSIIETFGLVYLEALTQNSIILYTRNQGIDGLFTQQFGEAVSPFSVKEIKEKLLKILTTPENYINNLDVDFDLFRWENIAKRYDKIYEECL